MFKSVKTLILGVSLQNVVAGFLIISTKKASQNRRSTFTIKEQFLSLCNWRYNLLVLNIFLYSIALTVVFVFVTDYAELKGVSDMKAVYLVSIIGISNALGRLLNIPISFCNVSPGYIYVISCIFSGVAVCLMNIRSDSIDECFSILAVACACYGLGYGVQHANLTIVANCLTSDAFLNTGFGFAMLFSGGGVITGSPVAGLLAMIFSV